MIDLTDIDDQSRRTLVKSILAGGVLTTIPGVAMAGRMGLPQYRVHLINAHTDEKFNGVYRVGNKYLPDAFRKINHFMRDFRTNDKKRIDPHLIDILASIQVRSKQRDPITILSGYRSPKTNAMLRRGSSGVAKNSYHMKGQAADIQIKGYSTRKLRNIARELKIGGVGYYPRSDFIHVDTGDVRTW